MKFCICISLIYLCTVVFCHHTADSENQRRDENLITSEHSREDRHEYDAYEREARRKFEHRKSSVDTFKRIPAVRRIVPGEDEHNHDHDSIENGSNPDSEKKLHHEDDANSDRSSFSDEDSDDHVNYHHSHPPEEYPELPIQPPSAPPVVFFGPQPPIGRRQIRLPVYRRPSYSRLYDAGPLPVPVTYRAINPVAYSVPTRVRNVVLGYPSSALASPVRYAYSAPNPALDAGVVPLEYRGYLAEEYDEFLKKK